MAPHTHIVHQPYSILVNGEVSFGHPNPRQPLLACSSAYRGFTSLSGNRLFCGVCMPLGDSLRLASCGLIRLRGVLIQMVETRYTDSDSTRIHPNYEASTMFSANCLAILGPNHDLHAPQDHLLLFYFNSSH